MKVIIALDTGKEIRPLKSYNYLPNIPNNENYIVIDHNLYMVKNVYYNFDINQIDIIVLPDID